MIGLEFAKAIEFGEGEEVVRMLTISFGPASESPLGRV